MTPAAEEAARGLGGLDAKSATLAVTMGNLASQGIQRAIGALTGLGREALAAVGSYEMLALSTSALVAKELRAADSTLSMGDALDQAGPRAEELLRWIEQLAIASPFSSDDVSRAFKLAQTYGFTSSQAQVLTQAILNFAAATGQSGAILQQLAYPLGQIARAGKVLTQDLRQLTTAGIDVTAILKSIGKTWDDVSGGTIQSNEFLQAFVATLNEDFAGAAARSQNTLQGLIASLGDLKTIGLRNLAAPAVKAFEEAFSPLIGKIQNGLLPALKIAGEQLGQFTRFLLENRQAIFTTAGALAAGVGAFLLITNASTIAGAAVAGFTAILTGAAGIVAAILSPIGILAAAVAGLAALFVFSYSEIDSKTKSFFGGMTGDLFSFGENIIMSLANGMAAAIGAVVSVLTQIGAVIASWLAPGSPPALLPDIDEWGAEAMNEYLRGMEAADFGIFNQLSSTIGGFLRSLFPNDDPNLIPTILQIREAISAAIASMSESGEVGADALQGIFDSLGIVNPDLQEYISLLFEASQANEALKQAQEALNEITQRYSDMLSPLRDELNAISQEQQRTARADRRKELEGILETARANGDAEAERRALLELRALDLQDQIALIEAQEEAETEAAQETVDAAQEAAEAAAEQLAAQQALIAAQTENNQLIQQQIDLLERLAEQAAGGAGGAAGGGGAPSLPAIPLELPPLPVPDAAPFSSALQNLQKRFNDFVANLRAPFADLEGKLSKMREAWGNAFTGAGNVIIEFVNGLNGKTTEAKNAVYQFANEAGQSLYAFLAGITDTKVTGLSDFAEFANGVGYWTGVFLGKLGAGVISWGGNFQLMQSITETARALLISKFTEIAAEAEDFARRVAAGALVVIGWMETAKGNITGALSAIGGAFEATQNNVTGVLTIIGSTIQTFGTTAVTNFTTLKDQAIGIFQTLLEKIGEKIDGIYTTVTGKIEEIITWVSGKVETFRNLGSSLMSGMAEGVMSAIQGLVDAVIQGIQDALAAAADLLDPGSPSRVTAETLGKPFAQGIGKGFEEALPAVQRMIAGGISSLLQPDLTPLAIPVSSSQVAGNSIANTYNTNITGVGQASVHNGMDLAMLESFIINTVNKAVQYG